MTSILGTQSIQHPNGTAAMTVAADGLVSFGNVKSGNTPCFQATFSSPLNSNSNNVDIKVRFNDSFIRYSIYQKSLLQTNIICFLVFFKCHRL